jgi:hypothetical protein
MVSALCHALVHTAVIGGKCAVEAQHPGAATPHRTVFIRSDTGRLISLFKGDQAPG